MRNLTLARRYAQALTDIGVRDGHCELYIEELQRVRTVIRSHPDLRRITTGPLLSRDRLKEIISVLAGEMGISPVVHNFLKLLVDKARIRYLEDITDIAQELLDERTNVVHATVTTADLLSGEELDMIRRNLERYAGKKVIIHHKKDSCIIGGVVAQIGDIILDYSIRKQLSRMREQLSRR
ncbi:MAG: ATP synthase F1 subunit delta [Deltaproteobacteria bacterium]|nr:ATP synthase F1 subunit delta [Deltaproteobacteria bacterium]